MDIRTAWSQIPGSAHDIAVGGNGAVWIIGTDQAAFGFRVYALTSGGFQPIANGSGDRIAADVNGNAIVRNAVGDIWFWRDGRWQPLGQGKTDDVAIGGQWLWATGYSSGLGPYGKDHAIFYWAARHWQQFDGYGRSIAANPAGEPWVCNAEYQVFYVEERGWNRAPGEGVDVGVGTDGTVWLVGSDNGLYRWDRAKRSWDHSVTGTAIRVAVDPAGNPWVVGTDLGIYRGQIV